MVVRSAAGLGGNGCEGGVRLRPATPSCTADQQQRHTQPEHFCDFEGQRRGWPALSVNLLTVHTPILGFPLGRPFHKCGTRKKLATPRECQQLVRLDALCRGKHGGVICIPVCCLVLVGFCDATSRTLHEHNVNCVQLR